MTTGQSPPPAGSNRRWRLPGRRIDRVDVIVLAYSFIAIALGVAIGLIARL